MHDGYPVYFAQEVGDCGFTTTCIGVSSFGFGGTNSRADLYGRCLKGPRDTGNVWTYERLRARNEAYRYGLRNSYKGALPMAPPIDAAICIVGTWNAYEKAIKMQSPEPGVYTARITLGDTRAEKFQLCINGDTTRAIYPTAESASASSGILGPDALSDARQWMINGAVDGMPSGTVYKVKFQWAGGPRSISWEVDPDAPPLQYFHRYDLCSTTMKTVDQMQLISEEEGLYESVIPLGKITGVEFKILRDQDPNQVIYPAMNRTIDPMVPVKGPGPEFGNGSWFLEGEYMAVFKIQLRVVHGKIIVSVISPDGEQKDWQNSSDPSYYVTGTFNNWKLTAMSPDQRIDGLFRYNLTISDSEHEEFQVLVDSNNTGEIAPVNRLDGDLDQPWRIEGKPGSQWSLLLDLNQDDPAKRVYWRKSTSRELNLPIVSAEGVFIHSLAHPLNPNK